MSTYDPTKARHRADLALSLVGQLTKSGFTKAELPGTNEAVYERSVDGTDGRIRVLVYTSVVPGTGAPEVRTNGDDSIKVCAVYRAKRDDKERGVVKNRRVHRSGDIRGKDGILDRVLGRMRDVYKAAKTGCTCSDCGAPKFITKKGSLACAELCWLSDEDVNRPYTPRRRRSSYRRRRW